MQRLNLSGGTYQMPALSVSAQRCLNLYPEPVPQVSGEPCPVVYYPTPGLAPLVTLSGTIRCLYQTTQGDMIAVAGAQVVRVYKDGSVTHIGTISGGATPVRMADNGTTLFIVDGAGGNGWYCALPALIGRGDYGAITRIVDDAFYGSPTIALLDTFFLFVNPDTSNWYTSPAQFADEATTPFDALYVASSSTAQGTIVAIAVVGQVIWLFTRNQVEFWYDSGASDFPFQRQQGVTVETGCVAPYAVCTLGTTAQTPNGGVIWLGKDRSGYSRVYLGQLSAAKPISTFPIDAALQAQGDLTEAVASTYQQSGHLFYVLTIPGASSSWVYDVTTDLWHERCALDASGNEAQIRPFCFGEAYGVVFAGDYENGTIYRVSPDIQDDAGRPIKRQRAFPHLLTNGARGIHRQFCLDMQGGAGQSISVDWSDDRGGSYGAVQSLTLAPAGSAWPTIWRLGMARDRVYRLTWTAPGPTALMGAFVQIDGARS